MTRRLPGPVFTVPERISRRVGYVLLDQPALIEALDAGAKAVEFIPPGGEPVLIECNGAETIIFFQRDDLRELEIGERAPRWTVVEAAGGAHEWQEADHA